MQSYFTVRARHFSRRGLRSTPTLSSKHRDYDSRILKSVDAKHCFEIAAKLYIFFILRLFSNVKFSIRRHTLHIYKAQQIRELPYTFLHTTVCMSEKHSWVKTLLFLSCKLPLPSGNFVTIL
jgi:hypothetical protein